MQNTADVIFIKKASCEIQVRFYGLFLLRGETGEQRKTHIISSSHELSNVPFSVIEPGPQWSSGDISLSQSFKATFGPYFRRKPEVNTHEIEIFVWQKTWL